VIRYLRIQTVYWTSRKDLNALRTIQETDKLFHDVLHEQLAKQKLA